MRCPSCLKVISEEISACPECNFSLEKLDMKFGTVPKQGRRVTDLAEIFVKSEQIHLEQRMLALQRRFRGLHVSVVTMQVNPRFKPREYLFWLVNRGRFAPATGKFEQSLYLVLFFDMTSRSVFLTTGYGLQEALPEEALQRALEVGMAALKKNQFYRASRFILGGVLKELKTYSKNLATKEKVKPNEISEVSGLQNA